MKKGILITVTALMGAYSFAAISQFTDDFNTASSTDYTEGGTVGGNNGWVAPTNGVPFYTTDTAGNGLVEIVPATDNFISMGRNVGSFSVGQTITVSSLFNIGSTASAFNNALAWNIGLGDSNNNVDFGLGVGGDSTDWYIRGYDGNGSIFDLSGDNTGALQGLGRDTDQHTISVSITKSATADTFDLEYFFDTTSLGVTNVTDGTLYNAANIYLVGKAGGGGVNAVGGVDVDNISVVPEPATLGLVAFMGGAIMFIRRHCTL